MAQPPEDDFVDRHEQRHRIWPIRDPALLERLDAGLAQSRALIADGHHRYAAYLRMQTPAPGGPSDRGLAMLVDQEDTPLFLGPIHRVLSGATLEDLGAAAESVGARFELVDRGSALNALGPSTLVATDARDWATVKLDVPAGRAAVEMLHDELIPALPRGPERIRYHHGVDDALAQLRRGTGVAVLMPAPGRGPGAADRRRRPAAARRRRPRSSRSPASGVLIRSLRDE